VPRQKLRETLEELERELEQTDVTHAASRERLEHVIREVRALLEETAREGDAERSLLDRVREATREFEEEHPALAETIGRVATALSNMGI
jgi:hypothetical protein